MVTTEGARSAEQTFAMVDLAGYTALTEAHGDEAAADLATRFATIAADALADGDRLIKAIGDAVLLASRTPTAGLELVQRLLTSCGDLDGFPLARAGLHHGPAVERDGDVFGTAVNLTARIAGQAAGGQVLTTGTVALAARERGLPTVSIGAFGLRNLTEPVELFEVDLGLSRPARSIDPVCRMWIDHGRSAGRLRHEDRDFWFCSLECAATFATTPGRYPAV